MVSPVPVAITTYDSGSSNASSWTPLSGEAVNPGELLIFICSTDGNPTLSTSSPGWTLQAQGDVATGWKQAIFSKVADDSSEDLTINSSTNETFTGVLYRIASATTLLVSSIAGGAAPSPANPPPVSPGVTRDYMFIVTRGNQNASSGMATAAPAGYSDFTSRASPASSTAGSGINTAHKLATASSEDPGAFTEPGTANWLSYTIAVWNASVSMSAEGGSFTLTGTAANLRKGSKIIAEAGTFALGSTPVDLKRPGRIDADGAAFALGSTAANLEYGRKLIVDETGMGPELILNGGFDAGISAWTDASPAGAHVTWNPAGYVELTRDPGGGQPVFSQTVPTIIGRTYELRFNGSGGSAATRSNVGTASGLGGGLLLTNPRSFVADKTTTTITFDTNTNSTTGGTTLLDNVSLKEIGSGLGPDLLTNGDFNAGVAGWSGVQATVSAVGGKLRVTATVIGFASGYQPITGLTPGKLYEVEVGDLPSGGQIGVYNTAAASGPLSAPYGSNRVRFRAVDSDASVNLFFFSAAVGEFKDFDNVTCRQVFPTFELVGADVTLRRGKALIGGAEAGVFQLNPPMTNLVAYSRQLNMWSAQVGASVVANTHIAPDGTLTADTVNLDVGTISGISRPFTGPAPGRFSESFYIRGTVGGEKIMLAAYNGTDGLQRSPEITLGLGFERYKFSFNATVFPTNVYILQSNIGTPVAKSIVAWHGQVVAGDEMGPPIETNEVAVTAPSNYPVDLRRTAILRAEPDLDLEKIVNGGFDSDSWWTKGLFWTISDGVASKAVGDSSQFRNLSRNGLLTAGKLYLVKFDVLSASGGFIRVVLGNNTVGTSRTEPGSYEEAIFLPTTEPGHFHIQAEGFFVGSIDNVSVREIIPTVTLTGEPVALKFARRLIAAAGSFLLSALAPVLRLFRWAPAERTFQLEDKGREFELEGSILADRTFDLPGEE